MRVVGRRAAFVARREASGYTQESFASRVGVQSNTVGRWERGELIPQPWRRPRIAKALGVSLDQLEALLVVNGPARLADSDRQPNEPDTLFSGSAFSALNVDEQRRVEAALADAVRYFDAVVVAYFRRQLDHCMTSDGEQGPAQTTPTVLALLGAVEQCNRAVRSDVRPEVLSFAACAAEFAGWLYRDVHDPEQARFWYDRATEWAQEAGDTLMQGYVLLKKSQMAYDTRDALRVLSLARAALEGPWQLPARIRAEVTQQEALGMAMTGEPLSAVERKLDDARLLLAGATNEGGPGVPGAYFTETTLMLRTATSLVEAGKPARGAVLFGEVLADAPLSRRDAGFFRARRAAALALSGEPDHAATLALESAAVAAATDSKRTFRVLSDVMASLTPWGSRPLVRELRDALTAGLTA